MCSTYHSFKLHVHLAYNPLLTLIIVRGTVFDHYYNSDLLPDQYLRIVYTLALGTVLAVIASEFNFNLSMN